MKATRERDSSWEQKKWWLLGVIFCTLAVYLPALANGFTSWDDNSHVYENPLIRSLSLGNIRDIFQGTVFHSYIPLTVLSFAVEYHFFGLNPLVYHLTNILLHIAVTVGFFILASRLTGSCLSAAIAALIFGIHPVHVESVAWVTERKDVLYSLFYLGSLLAYCEYVGTQKRSRYLWSICLGLLAILSKAMALSLPLILFVLDWFLRRKFDKKLLLEKLPYFIAIVPIAAITYSLNARIPGRNLIEGTLIWVWTFTFYLRKFFFPFELLPYYVLPKPVIFTNWHYGAAVLLFLALTLFLYLRRKDRYLVFAMLYFFVSIFFLLRYDNTIDTTIVSDRFLYLPCLGLCVWAGVAVEKIWGFVSNRQVLRTRTLAFLFIVFGWLALKTYNQTQMWKDGVTLWEENIRRHPGEYLPYFFRGYALQERGEYAAALSDYNKAMKIKTNFGPFHNDRGLVYLFLKKYDLALSDFNQAIKLQPRAYQGYANRGLYYYQQGDFIRAIADYQKSVELATDYVSGYFEIAKMYELQGDWAAAIGQYGRIIQADARIMEAYFKRAVDYSNLGQQEQAIADYNQILKMDPRNFEVLTGRGNSYLALDLIDQAIADYTRAIQLNPSRPELFSNRGLAYARKGDLNHALEDLGKAIALDPQAVVALENRGIIYAQQRNFPLALADFNEVIRLKPRAEAYYSRGLIYYELGQYAQALSDFDNALSMDNTFEPARAKKAEAELKLK